MTIRIAFAPGLLPRATPRRRSVSPLMAWLRAAVRRVRQRRALAELDDRALRDIGVTRVEAQAEANKPFWRR